jgi:hypothetical protein
MSLAIKPERITGIYAHDQWFEVLHGSVCIDAYELLCEEDEDSYQMGTYLADKGKIITCPGLNHRSIYPSPSTGIQFIEKNTKAVISFALIEVKAFAEAPRK